MTQNTEGGAAATNDYSALVGELDTMLKAQSADEGDKKIAAAAADAGNEGGEGQGEGTGAGAGDEEDEGEGEAFGKAFEVTLEDGTKAEAYDGTQMMKALYADNLKLKAENEALTTQVGQLGAGLKSATTLLKNQGEMLKALQGDVKKLGGQGAGRKTMLTVHDKPATTAGSGERKVGPADVMLKAQSLFNDGKLEGRDYARIEAHINRGQVPPQDIIDRHPDLVA